MARSRGVHIQGLLTWKQQPVCLPDRQYWYTADNDRSQRGWCDCTRFGKQNVRIAFQRPGKPSVTADVYLELTFTEAPGTVETGETSSTIQMRLANDKWRPYDETNYYSLSPEMTDFAPWSRVTLYRKGQLVWGAEPAGQ